MEIKTFEAFSMKDAVKALKRDLGSDAVILSTKEKASPTGNGRIYEVTAATSHSTKSARPASHMAGDPAILNYLESISTKLAYFSDTLPTKKQIESTESGICDLKLYLMELLKSKSGSAFEGLTPELFALEKHLRLMGLDDSSIVELVKHLQAVIPLPYPNKDNSSKELIHPTLKSESYKWMYKQIKICPKWRQDQSFPQIKVVVGPYGSGKSSLIAKLASFYYKREKFPVKIVSVDHNKLAASDQMRVFSKILGVPFHIVSSISDLDQIVKESQNSLILVDTPGFGSKEKDLPVVLGQIFSKKFDVEYHLCLASTEKESYLEKVIQHALNLGISGISFTKLDQSLTYGELFNLSKRWSIPLAYFSYGTNIPDDLERATKERVIERIFGS